MEVDPRWILAAATAGIVLLGFASALWLAIVIAWGDRRTRGLSYFGLPREGREAFKRRLRFHARLLAPVIRVVARASPFSFERASFVYRGVSGPRGACTLESFRAGASYEPRPSDVFVVTQMRSGTTWMQHLVYEILMRGQGDLVEAGRTLNAVSPWLESVIGVPAEDAPPLGRERPSRVIKTHFPVSLCPYSSASKYVYVARNPVSCFASCADFLADDLGAAAPSVDALEAWFCSDERMWWGGWPSHVDGWWHRSLEQENVLFVRFEDMVEDLAGVAAGVTTFLGLSPLDDREMDAVRNKAGFAYMKRHKDTFEMYPPHILAADSAYFVKGTKDRDRDVPGEVRARIMDWCSSQLAQASFPLDRFYPAPTGEPGHDPTTRPVSA